MKHKKLNERSKKEQMLILLLCAGIFGMLCLSGCGGKSCETPKCGNEKFESGGKAAGCSVPGCGGCLTPEDGCNSACWPQSCKFVRGSWYAANIDSGEETDKASVTACDTRYFGDGCMGCGQKEKSCYYGYINASDTEYGNEYGGFVFGSTDGEEQLIGCVNGFKFCYGTDGSGKEYIQMMEESAGIK